MSPYNADPSHLPGIYREQIENSAKLYPDTERAETCVRMDCTYEIIMLEKIKLFCNFPCRFEVIRSKVKKKKIVLN